MPEIWQQMTIEEKLDDLKGSIQKLTQTLTISLGRINSDLRQMNDCLSNIDNNIKFFATHQRASDYTKWSEKP